MARPHQARGPARRGFRHTGEHWLWVGGPVPRGADAITIGSIVIVRTAALARPDAQELLAHERVHVSQFRTLGTVRFLRRYIGSYARWRLRGYGHWAAYRRIPFETEAYWEVRRSTTATEAPALSPLPAPTPAR